MPSDYTDAQVQEAVDTFIASTRITVLGPTGAIRSAMRAALLAAERSAWQSIETAPAEPGKKIILGGYWDNGGGPDDGVWEEQFAVFGSVLSGSKAKLEWMIGLGSASRWAVRWVYWRPLLPPPEPAHD